MDGVIPRGKRITLAVTLRLATEADLPALEWYGAFRAHRSIIAQVFGAQQTGSAAMVLADVNGFPVGQAWLDYRRRRMEGRAVIWALRVLPPFRGAGLGTALMLTAERLAAQRGFAQAELGVDTDNAGVLAFYDRLGYSPCGREDGRFTYQTPDGETVEQPIAQWLLRKTLPEAPARRSGSGG